MLGWSIGALIVVACGAPRLAAPDYTGHPTTALEEVAYPPPPAQAEAIPKRPSSAKGNVVWLDGEWVWQARRWGWRPGRWVVAPSGARYAPWTAVRDRLGTLYVAHGAWRDASGKEIAEPEALAVANATLPTVVAAEGGLEVEDTIGDAGVVFETDGATMEVQP